jgi:outer membrane protein
MDQAVAMAMDANLALRAARLTPASAAQDIAAARAAYAPTVQSGVQRNTSNSPPANFTQGASGVYTSNTTSTSSTWQQLLPLLGSSYSVTWSGSRNTSGGFPSFNPSLSSSLSVSYSQPLLRNLKTDSSRMQVRTATETQQIDDLQLKETVVQTERNVRTAYLQLVGSIKERDVAQEILNVANEQYKNDNARVNVGTMAPSDIVGDEVQISTAEESVISADAGIENAEDALRGLIFDPSRADFWTVHIQPTDDVILQPREIDVDKAIQNALANRADLVAARKSLGLNDLSIQLLQNQKLPQLDFRLNYSAVGEAGTLLTYGSGFPPQVVSQTNRSYAGALGDTFSNAFPSWTYGVVFSYPLGESTLDTSLAKARVSKSQAQINLENQELQLATAVRSAARNVETARKRVDAATKARENSERLLDAARKKADVGLITNFEVLQDESALASAKINELDAIIAYNQALIDFDAVQR